MKIARRLKMSNIDYGKFGEALNDKADRDLRNTVEGIDCVVSYKTPTSQDPTWYRVYKSGWVEQGGIFNAFSSIGANTASETTLNLVKNMKDTNYTFIANGRCENYSAAISVSFRTTGKTTNSLLIGCRNHNNGASGQVYVEWQVSGQIDPTELQRILSGV